MKPRRIDVLLKVIILLGGLLAVPNSWASSDRCMINAGGTGMGGTGIVAKGTGIGGTGIIAEGTGIGGTGITGATALAGKVLFSSGHIVAMNNGSSRILAKGDPVCVGDTIQSAKAASAQLVMIDNEMIAVRPETKLRIDSYAYRGKSDDNIALALLDGATRIISGKIGKRLPQNDLIITPNSTIGIRGTDHEATVILPGQNAAYPAGTYDKVNSGMTFIKTEKGSIDIQPNQVGFAAGQEELPKLLPSIPAFYNSPPVASFSRGMETTDDKAGNGESGMHQGMEKSFEQPGENPELGKGIGSDSAPGESVHIPGAEIQSLPESRQMPESQQIPQPPSDDLMRPEIMTPPGMPEIPGISTPEIEH